MWRPNGNLCLLLLLPSPTSVMSKISSSVLVTLVSSDDVALKANTHEIKNRNSESDNKCLNIFAALQQTHEKIIK